MIRDYAKRKVTSKRAQKNKSSHFIILGALVLVMLVGMVSLWLVMRPAKGNLQGTKFSIVFSKIVSLIDHKKKNLSSSEEKQVAEEKKPEVEFDFYNELPHMQIKVSNVLRANTPVSTPAIAVNTSYVIQIATSKSEGRISELRISLLLAGVDADIVKKGDIFCLQKGPYVSLSSAKAIQKQLQKKGIESQVSKI